MIVMVKGIERIKQYYYTWAVLFGFFLFFFFTSSYSFLLPHIIVLLLLKDVVIDILWKHGSVPEWFEHAPFVLLISILGIFNLFGANFLPNILTLQVTLLAALDAIIDISDDLGMIRV
ncbi:MAG: hypothetical protein Q7S21_03515 [archaeon]|nr:hypothetical protein [archaeon]